LYFPYILGVTVIFSSVVWHSFDLGEQSLCYFQNATCGTSCEFENTFSSILDQNIQNAISWRPTCIALSSILSFLSIPLIYVKKINNFIGTIIFLLYFSVSLFLGILSFYTQKFCGTYEINKCECVTFSNGMIKLCSIPFFELSIFISICYLSYILQNKRVYRKKRAVIHVNNKDNNSTQDVEFIDLPNNRQYNYMQSSSYIQTTRDKWFDIIGF